MCFLIVLCIIRHLKLSDKTFLLVLFLIAFFFFINLDSFAETNSIGSLSERASFGKLCSKHGLPILNLDMNDTS